MIYRINLQIKSTLYFKANKEKDDIFFRGLSFDPGFMVTPHRRRLMIQQCLTLRFMKLIILI